MEDRMVIQHLEEMRDSLKKMKVELEERLQGTPSGTLECKMCRTTQQFYQRINGKMNYIRKSDRELAERLAQRDYDRKLLMNINDKIHLIEKFLAVFNLEKIYNLYDELTTVRKSLVKPLLISDADYINQWKRLNFEGKEFAEGTQEIYTERGERVRSKSEKIIADKLFLKNIPYHYERPIYLKGFGKVYPDFHCLNIYQRKEIIWEHFGMMGDAEYSRKALKKMDLYTQNGYYHGDNIIYTFESSENPMNTKTVDLLIENHFSHCFPAPNMLY